MVTDTTYQYRLQAQAAAGYGVRSAALSASVTPPPPPADLTYFGAAQTGVTTVEAAWDPVPGASGYDVEIQQSHGAAYVRLPQAGTFALRTGPETTDTVTVTVARTGTTATVSGLPAEAATWELRVVARNGNVESVASAAVSVTNPPA